MRFIPRSTLTCDFERWLRRQLSLRERQLISHIEYLRHSPNHTIVFIDQDTLSSPDSLCLLLTDYLNWIHDRFDKNVRAAVIGRTLAEAKPIAARLHAPAISASLRNPDKLRGNTYEHVIITDAHRLRAIRDVGDFKRRSRDFNCVVAGATCPAMTNPRGIAIVIGSVSCHPRRPFARRVRSQRPVNVAFNRRLLAPVIKPEHIDKHPDRQTIIYLSPPSPVSVTLSAVG